MSEKKWHQNPWAWCGCGCCLGIVVIPFLLASLGVGGAFWALRNVGVQDEALRLAQSNPAVVEQLGEPLEIGWLMSGNISFENDSGTADYSIPIIGPDGRGKLFVVAERENGEWTFDELYVLIDGQRIDLASDAPPQPIDAGAAIGESAASATDGGG